MDKEETRELVFELTKLLIYATTELLRMVRATEEEKERIYNEALEQFQLRDPGELEDV